MQTKHKWLITGGAGFIGSHIVERLIKEGQAVRVLDSFYSGNQKNIDVAIASNPSNFELIKGDIRDKSACEKACQGIDFICHEAALRSVPKSMLTPHEYNDVNIDGSLNILEAALKAKVKRVVIASSSSIYGDTDSFPEKETDTPLLISPYALSKLAVEYYSRIFSENYGLETVNLRYFNVFGPRQALDDDYAVVIPKFITCMLNGEQPPIFGTGKQSRDFTYIDNVVEANILAATHNCEGLSLRGANKVSDEAILTHKTFCEVLNVACGKENSVLDLVDSINKILGTNIEPKLLPVRKGDVFRTSADISKIEKVINYKPKATFEQGLEKTIEYFRGTYVTKR